MKARPETASDRHFRPGERIDREIVRVAGLRLREATAHLAHPRAIGDEEIHAVRTAIKEVRALLRLLRPAIGDPAFRLVNDQLRKTARLLSPTRDRVVILHTLGRLRRAAHRHGRRRDSAAVNEIIARQLLHPPHSARQPTRAATLRALQRSRQDLRSLRLVSRQSSPLLLEQGLGAIYRQCRRRMRAAFTSADDDHFHRWRIRLKNLYYALQFLTPLDPERLRPMVARLKKVQETIGNDHDLTIVKTALQKDGASDPAPEDPTIQNVLRQLQKRSQKLRAKCQSVAEKTLEEKPAHFIGHIARAKEVGALKAWRPFSTPSP